MEQTPLRVVLEPSSPELGRYQVEFPASVCFGNGRYPEILIRRQKALLLLFANSTSRQWRPYHGNRHKAASDFVSKSSQSQAHLHLLHISLQFFRPTFPTPNTAFLIFRFANVAKAQTTLHVELTQKDKTCGAGYIT